MSKKLLSFQTYRNRAAWKKVKAETFDDAFAKFREQLIKAKDKTNYYEMKNETGKLVPVL